MIHTLVVEDDPIWSEYLLAQLPHDQFAAIHTNNLASSFATLKDSNFDLICLDLELPDSHAANTLHTIVTAVPYTAIVVTTAISDDNITKLAFTLGVQDFIVKSQFTTSVFVHAALLSVQRLNARISGELNKNFENILTQLKSVENKLVELSPRPAAE